MPNNIALKVGTYDVNAPGSIPQGNQASDILSNALTILIVAAVIAALITIIWAGIKWTTSDGDKQKVAAARARLTWGIIGLVIVLLSIFIINVLSSLFGVNLLNLQLG
jgi:hypothetical protein